MPSLRSFPSSSAAVAVGCSVVGVLLTAMATQSTGVAVVCLGMAVVGLVVLTQGIVRTATGILVVATFFSPLNSVRPTASASFVTAADLLFVVGFLLLLPELVKRPLRPPTLFAFGTLIMLVTGVIASLASGEAGLSLNVMMRFVFAAIGLPIAFMLWRPSLRVVGWLAAAYLAGSVVSVMSAVASGPEVVTGRYVGLTTHYNFLGLSTLLGALLVPFVLSQTRRSRHLVVWGAGLICLYGVYISGSRAALLMFIVVAVIYPVVERSLAAAAALVLAGTVGVAMLPKLLSDSNSALGRLFGGGGADYADDARERLLADAIKQFHDRPIIGNGFARALEAHNIYLEIVVAVGVIGLFGYLMMFAAMILPLVTAPRPINRLAYPALGYALVGLVTNALWDRFIWGALSLSLLVHLLSEDFQADTEPVHDEAPELSKEPV